MRMVATRYARPIPLQAKKQVANVQHVQAPLKGLSLSSKLVPGDPLTAPVLDNFVIEEDRIAMRAGYTMAHANILAGSIVGLIPWYGAVPKMAAASATQFAVVSGTFTVSGFHSGDWSWTSFANLGADKFTVMCNGVDGVWSWNGGEVADGPATTVTSLSNANPAVCTVAAGNIGRFTNGQLVRITGADVSHAAANGYHPIASVNVPANTFQLVGVDLSAAGAPQTVGVSAVPMGSMIKEAITAPGTAPWIVPDQFQIVLSHMNRLWFADATNLAVFYLPLQQKSGQVTAIPLNAIFKRGGSVRAMYTWTQDGGVGLNDMMVVFTTNGEAALFSGVDPEDDMQVTGVFRFDAPMSKHSVINYGGDLYVMISTGVVPFSVMLRSEQEQLGQIDRNVISVFLGTAVQYRDKSGWQLLLNPSTSRLICNMPLGAPNRFMQMVRHMPRPVWSSWSSVPARCWAWIDPYLYFGDDSGNVFRMHPQFLNDNGKPITVDVQPAWSIYKTPGVKLFKMVQAYMTTDGTLVQPFIDIKVDYDYSLPSNQPELTTAPAQATWDIAPWDTSDWASGDARAITQWTGVGALGRVGAPRLRAQVVDCHFEVNGFDVLYEVGAVVG